MSARQLVLTGLVLCCALWGEQAAAHAFLQTASPPVGSTVRAAPAQVVIDFTEGVEPLFSAITVTDTSGARMDTGAVHLARGQSHLAVAVRRLLPGVYTVRWHATATDTHKTAGSYVFTVSP